MLRRLIDDEVNFEGDCDDGASLEVSHRNILRRVALELGPRDWFELFWPFSERLKSSFIKKDYGAIETGDLVGWRHGCCFFFLK